MTGKAESGAASCPSYNDPHPPQPTKELQQGVTIALLFTPFSYDLMKEYSSWNYLNSYGGDDDYDVFKRFVTVLNWDSIHGEPNMSGKEISLDQVPARNKLDAKAKFDKNLFIDCSYTKEKEIEHMNNKIAGHVDPAADGMLDNVNLADLVGYLSLAISEVKDHLYRLSKQGYYGKVNFVVAAYEPVHPLMYTFLDLAGIGVNRCSSVSYFTDFIKQDAWFGGFESWMKDKLKWTPVLKEAALYKGYFYGISQETEHKKNKDRAAVLTKELKRMDDLAEKHLGEGITVHTNHAGNEIILSKWGESQCEKWKNLGEHTTDYNKFGQLESIYGKGESADWSLFSVGIAGQQGWMEGYDHATPAEMPIGKVEGRWMTVKQMLVERDKCWDKAAETAKTPMYFIGKRASRRLVDNAPPYEPSSEEMQEEFDRWEQMSYNPQVAENKSWIQKMDDRDSGTEHEIWKRKQVEDEGVSDKWSAGKDDILYNGRVVKRSYFEEEIAKLKKEYDARKDAITDKKKREEMEIVLKILAGVQVVCAIASFGAATPLTAAIFIAIDVGLTVGKVAVKFHYDKSYTMAKAAKDHLLDVLMDVFAGVLLVPAFMKFSRQMTKVKTYTVEHTAMPTEMNKLHTAPPTQMTQASTAAPTHMTQVSTAAPTQMTSMVTTTESSVLNSTLGQMVVKATNPKITKASYLVKQPPTKTPMVSVSNGNVNVGAINPSAGNANLQLKFGNKQLEDAENLLTNFFKGLEMMNEGKAGAGALHLLQNAGNTAVFLYTGKGIHDNSMYLINTNDVRTSWGSKTEAFGRDDQIDGKKAKYIFKDID